MNRMRPMLTQVITRLSLADSLAPISRATVHSSTMPDASRDPLWDKNGMFSGMS